MSLTNDQAVSQLRSATEGFDFLFSNQITEAREVFKCQDSPYHLLGLGVCAFLEAALGMETGLMTEATRCLNLAEVGSRKQLKSAKASKNIHRFTPGIEWEIINADVVVLLGLTHALSESYMGYLQCMYSLNSAHSKFTKLYKAVFPNGLDSYKTPAATPVPSRKPSTPSLHSQTAPTATVTSTRTGFLGRWGSSTLSVPKSKDIAPTVEGPVEELIVAGTSFGFGLFNLVFSLLPAKIRGVVGFFGFQHDRKLALQALAVSAARTDVHSVFAGLVLMTYHGVVLLLSGYQADEAHIIKQYKAIVDSVESRYPTGALWILNRAKILRMSHDAEGAINVLQAGLKPERPHSFAQADTLLVFELAWTLLAQRRYQDAADAFVRITELNSWSHATYVFIAGGCYVSLKNFDKAQELFDAIPQLLEKRKLSGKDLPTEVFIKKKLAFYKLKQKRRGGNESEFAKCMTISPAEEIAIFWNNQSRISTSIAEAHITAWSALTPPVTIPSSRVPLNPGTEAGPVDLDTPDELAIRALLLGIAYRTAGDFATSREFLREARKYQLDIVTSAWVGGFSMFEAAVLDLKEIEAKERHEEAVLSLVVSKDEGASANAATAELRNEWAVALKSANEKLDEALTLATSSTDLSSRLDSRINMLKDEMATKREMLGLA